MMSLEEVQRYMRPSHAEICQNLRAGRRDPLWWHQGTFHVMMAEAPPSPNWERVDICYPFGSSVSGFEELSPEGGSKLEAWLWAVLLALPVREYHQAPEGGS